MKRFVYADNAATTPVSQHVVDAMLPYFNECYGNPSSLYSLGRQAKKPLEEARATVAECLGALPQEIFFTSGGSEADNWAIKGIAHEMAKKGKKHIISSKFEHHAVLHSLDALKKEGKFDAEAQKTAKQMAIDKAKALITEDSKAAIETLYSDFEAYLNDAIEELVRENKVTY